MEYGYFEDDMRSEDTTASELNEQFGLLKLESKFNNITKKNKQLPLILEYNDTCFNGMVCEEYVDKGLLMKCLYYKNTRIEVRKLLLTYNDALSSHNKIQVRYNRDCKYGRVSAMYSMSMFNMSRTIRNTCTKDYYADVDIVNCHPTLLLQICQSNNLNCEYLNYYCNNREEILKHIMSTHNTNRDSAKKLMLILMYLGSYKKWIIDNNYHGDIDNYFVNFSKELKEIAKIIYNKNPDLVKSVGDRDNILSSVLSVFLQEYENKIIECVVNYARDNGIINNNFILCNDGIMIPLSCYNDDLLSLFSEIVYNTVGVKVKFERKIPEEFLTIDELNNNQITEDEMIYIITNGYSSIIEINDDDFNLQLFNNYFINDKVALGDDGYIKYFNHTRSFKYFNHYHIYLYGLDLLMSVNKSYNINFIKFQSSEFKIKKYRFIDLYFASSHKKSYRTFEFCPKIKQNPTNYNLFTGFKYDSDIINDEISFNKYVSPFLNHILYICDNNNEVAQYVINWISHIIQKPYEKTETVVVLFSHTHGVGKNVFTSILEKIIGYSISINNVDNLFDRFNFEMSNKLLCICNEVNASRYDVSNELKDIITRNTHQIEIKGKEKVTINDYKNYIFTTNNEMLIKVTQSDRRFQMIECTQSKKSNDYYSEIVNLYSTEEALRYLFSYFKNNNISKYNTRDIILTSYKKEVINYNMASYWKFIIYHRSVETKFGKKTSELYNMCIDYCKTHHLSYAFSQKLFSMELKKVFNDIYTKHSDGSYYFFCSLTNEEVEKRIYDYVTS
jgi:hypothetical protein